jgi:LPS O-antigen subunit length determinant protein (WzzB/FepE family)
VARVNEVRRERDIAEAAESIEYLDRELAKTPQVSIRDAIGRVLEEQLQKSTMANVRREYAFKVLEPGMLPERPIRPRRLRMILAGFLFGGLLMAFIVCAREGVFSPPAR